MYLSGEKNSKFRKNGCGTIQNGRWQSPGFMPGEKTVRQRSLGRSVQPRHSPLFIHRIPQEHWHSSEKIHRARQADRVVKLHHVDLSHTRSRAEGSVPCFKFIASVESAYGDDWFILSFANYFASVSCQPYEGREVSVISYCSFRFSAIWFCRVN